MDVTLRQLEIFQAVVVAGSITKASRWIGLAQPSISQQLAKLEEKLGTQLIQRNRSGVINLTPAGEYWSKAGRDLLDRLESTVHEHHNQFSEQNVYVRMGVPPTLRGRFAGAAARITSEQPGFIKFDLRFGVTSSELVEQLRLHKLNFAIVNRDTLAEDRHSYLVEELFEDSIGWIVPASVQPTTIKQTLRTRHNIPVPLTTFIEVDANPALHAQSSEWYHNNLPGSSAMFSTNNYGMAVDLVAEGLGTAHAPLSLVPNLPVSTLERVRIYRLGEITRRVVLAMPKHLDTLPAYNRIFKRIVEFCRTDYAQEMYAARTELLTPIG